MQDRKTGFGYQQPIAGAGRPSVAGKGGHLADGSAKCSFHVEVGDQKRSYVEALKTRAKSLAGLDLPALVILAY